MKLEWHNVLTTLTLELYCHDGKVFNADGDEKVADWLAPHVGEGATIEITVSHTGYYERAKWANHMEDSEPADYEDEITLCSVEKDGVRVDDELAEEIFEAFKHQIEAQDFGHEDR